MGRHARRVVVGQAQQGVVDHGHAQDGRRGLALFVGHQQRHVGLVARRVPLAVPRHADLQPPLRPAIDQPLGDRLRRAGAVVEHGQPDHAARLRVKRDRHRVGARLRSRRAAGRPAPRGTTRRPPAAGPSLRLRTLNSSGAPASNTPSPVLSTTLRCDETAGSFGLVLGVGRLVDQQAVACRPPAARS